MSGLKSTITIVGHRRVLISATAFRTGVLTHLLDLIAYVVGIHRSRIDGIVWSSPEGSRSVPVEDFGFHGAAEDVRVDLLLPALRHASIDGAFVGDRHHFTTSTTTSCVLSALCRAIRIGRH